MTEAVAQVSAWIDLHGGDIHEALLPIGEYESEGNPSVGERSQATLEVFGVAYAARTYGQPGMALRATTAAGIPSIIAEAGQMGRRDEEHTALRLRGCRNVALLLGIVPGVPLPVPRPKMLARIDWVQAQHKGCWYPAVAVGERIERDQRVGTLNDYFGNVIAEYRSPSAGVVVLSCTSFAMREQHTLLGVGILA